MSYKLQITFQDDLLEKVKRIAKSRGLSLAGFVRWVVAEWLEKNEKEGKISV